MRDVGTNSKRILRPLRWSLGAVALVVVSCAVELADASVQSGVVEFESPPAAPVVEVAPVEPRFEGCWNTVVELPWPAGDTSGELCIDKPPQGWGGKFFLEKKWRPLVGTVVHSNSISFLIPTPMGNVEFKANLETDRLDGSVAGKFGEHPFYATRK